MDLDCAVSGVVDVAVVRGMYGRQWGRSNQTTELDSPRLWLHAYPFSEEGMLAFPFCLSRLHKYKHGHFTSRFADWIVQNKKVDTVTVDETCEAAECNTPSLTTAKLNQASVTLAGSLLQELAAAWCDRECHPNEFENAKVVHAGDKTVFVMKVVDHKTASEGTANVVVEKTDHARIAL